MESDLETRWQRSVEERNLTPGELEIMVAEMERGGSIPGNWNQRMILSLAREKAEVEDWYGIKIGQTTVTCARCGGPWGFGGHVCDDIRFKSLNEAKEIMKVKAMESTPELCSKLRKLGAKKASTMIYLEDKNGVAIKQVSERAIRRWIKRGSVPKEYREMVTGL